MHCSCLQSLLVFLLNARQKLKPLYRRLSSSCHRITKLWIMEILQHVETTAYVRNGFPYTTPRRAARRRSARRRSSIGPLNGNRAAAHALGGGGTFCDIRGVGSHLAGHSDAVDGRIIPMQSSAVTAVLIYRIVVVWDESDVSCRHRRPDR